MQQCSASRTRSGKRYNKGVTLATHVLIGTTSSVAGSGLEDLPYEVLLQVAGRLDQRSWLNARLACRAWHALFSMLPYRVRVHPGKGAGDAIARNAFEGKWYSRPYEPTSIVAGRLYKAANIVCSAFPQLAHVTALLLRQHGSVDLSGSVQKVHYRGINTAKGLARQLLPLQHLRSLKLVQRDFVISIAPIAQLSRLEVLDLAECCMVSPDLPMICRGLSRLEDLKLTGTTFSTFTAPDCAALSQLGHLTSLEVSLNSRCSSRQLQAICSVASLVKLLLVQTCTYPDGGDYKLLDAQSMLPLSRLTNLQVLHSPFLPFDRRGVPADSTRAQAWRTVTASCTQLRELKWTFRFDWCPDVLEAVAATSLQSLHISLLCAFPADSIPQALPEHMADVLGQIPQIKVYIQKFTTCRPLRPLLQLPNVRVDSNPLWPFGVRASAPDLRDRPCARAGYYCHMCANTRLHDDDD